MKYNVSNNNPIEKVFSSVPKGQKVELLKELMMQQATMIRLYLKLL